MFKITNHPIHHTKVSGQLNDPRSGAVVYFEGKVRNHNEGHQVNSLEYQCYMKMAEKEGLKIIKEAIEKFDIYDALCFHREGHLQIGDVAVWVGVNSAHRSEAFEACQYIIDEVKARVPIWKKEHYVDLPAQWVACHHCGKHSHQEHNERG